MKAEKADYEPKCPHCEAELETVGLHEGEPITFLGVKWKGSTLAIFSCPKCHKIIGTAHQGWGESST